MRQAKFTPGPWHVENLVDDYGQYIHEFAVCHPQTVCEDTTVVNLPSMEDARLIAAAPEMYEALEMVMKAWEDLEKPDYDEIDRVLKKARGEK